MPVEVEDFVHSGTMVAKVGWGDLPPVVVGDAIEGICRARNLGDAALLGAVRSFEARGEHRGEGHSSVVGWLQHHCRLRKATARRIARLARFLPKLPCVEEALAAGEIGFDHVEVLADAYKDKYAEAWEAVAPKLLTFALTARFEDYARYARKFADDLCPKDPEDRFNERVDDRYFSLAATLDGFGHPDGWLTPFARAEIQGELDRLERELFAEDWAAAKAELGRDPEIHELARTLGQRYHDAFDLMARRSRALRGPSPAASFVVNIHMTMASYEAGLARSLGQDVPLPHDGFCEMDDGSMIPPACAVEATIEGHVRRIVFGAEDEPLSFGRAKRFFTPAQAAAVRAKFRRCTHRFGCDRSGPLLQTDHVTEHEDGGGTDVDNGQPRCGPHNRWKSRHKHDPPASDEQRHDRGQRRGPPPGW